MSERYICCVCSAPVGFPRNLFCKKCYKALSNESWVKEFAKMEQARRNDERNHPTIPLSSLTDAQLLHATKVC